jgi:hypothetical protein
MMRKISMKSISIKSINRIRNFDENDPSWRKKYNKSLFERLVFLEDESGLSSAGVLLREYKDCVSEQFAYYLSLDREEQDLIAPKLKAQVDEYLRREDETAALAKKLLARDYPEVGVS